MNVLKKLFGRTENELPDVPLVPENNSEEPETVKNEVERPVADILKAVEQRPNTFKFFKRVYNERTAHKEDWRHRDAVVIVVDTKTGLEFRNFFLRGRSYNHSVSHGLDLTRSEISLLRSAFWNEYDRRKDIEQKKARDKVIKLYERHCI